MENLCLCAAPNAERPLCKYVRVGRRRERQHSLREGKRGREFVCRHGAYEREYGKVRKKEGVDLEGELLFKAVHRNKKED